MLIVKYKGKTSLSAWGPETKSGMMTYPKDAEFLFIQFKLGSFMPNLPIRKDTGLLLPDATGQSFWLDSSTWQFPDFENADTFVDWLVHVGLLVLEPIVEAEPPDHSQKLFSQPPRHPFVRLTCAAQHPLTQ